MPWYKICAFSLYAQLCRNISKMGNQVVILQCIFPYILWKMTHDPFGLMWFLLININEDNASTFLFNAFMKKMFTFWEAVHLGQLSENTISEEKFWACIGVYYEMVPCRTTKNPMFNTGASSCQRCELALLHSGYRTWEDSFIFLNTYFLICKMGVPFLFC